MSLEAWGDEPWGAEDGPDIERLLGEGYRSAEDMTKAAHDVIDERLRQQQDEGWTPKHDDKHSKGEMAVAAACYALPADHREMREGEPGHRTFTPPRPRFWPWASSWWKPTDRRRDLVKAGALILAEIERIDRAAARAAAAPHTGEEHG